MSLEKVKRELTDQQIYNYTVFDISQRLIEREHKTALAYLNSECGGMCHGYSTVIVVLKGEVSAFSRLQAINILAVQFYYFTQENDCD